MAVYNVYDPGATCVLCGCSVHVLGQTLALSSEGVL